MSEEANVGFEADAGYGEPIIDEVARWLADQALSDVPVVDMFQQCCDRVLASGIPLWRAYLGYRTLHPLFASISLIWKRGEAIGQVEHLHDEAFRSEAWLRSPLYHLLSRRLPVMRRRLTGQQALVDFPLLEELQEQGGTDYLVYRIPFAGDDAPDSAGMLGSWCTDRESGFSDRDLAHLQRIQRRLAVACKVQIKDQTAGNVLKTYLGLDAGRKVLRGQIRRGDGELVHAVLWYSDMRRSTELADMLPPARFQAVLNAYFECTASAVMSNGGEVLRFIGDAVLAIFPIDPGRGGAANACRLALDGARDAQGRLDALNRRREALGERPLDYGLGLHVGEVMYGNIGIPERLEFSVIGAAANEVARLEELTKKLSVRTLLSEEFVAALPGAYPSVGRFELRGVGEEMEVFRI